MDLTRVDRLPRLGANGDRRQEPRAQPYLRPVKYIGWLAEPSSVVGRGALSVTLRKASRGSQREQKIIGQLARR